MARNDVAVAGAALTVAFKTLAGIATEKGQRIKAVTVDVEKTDIGAGKVVGTVTVANRSRRGFTLQTNGNDVNVTLLGVTRKVAA